MRKIELTELITSTKISPFIWGSNSNDLLQIFPKWKIRINELKEAKCPFIEIDSVEFYFDDDSFNGLSEIIIKNSNFLKDYQSEYFNLGWLNHNLNLEKTILKLKKLNLEFKIVHDKQFESSTITINNNIFLGFENFYDSDKIENSKLEKIYIKKA